MTILDNEYVLIEHDPVHRIYTTVWKKYTPSSMYRQIILSRMEDIAGRQVGKELTDLTLLPTISQEDAHWTLEISQIYYSRICRDHIHTCAIILADGTFTRLAIHNMMEEFRHTFKDMDTRLITRYFSDVPQAKQWLMNHVL